MDHGEAGEAHFIDVQPAGNRLQLEHAQQQPGIGLVRRDGEPNLDPPRHVAMRFVARRQTVGAERARETLIGEHEINGGKDRRRGAIRRLQRNPPPAATILMP